MTENEISKTIVSAAIEVHRTLGGPGWLESVYEEALAYELTTSIEEPQARFGYQLWRIAGQRRNPSCRDNL